MTALGTMTSEQLTEALKGVLALQHLDHHDRMRADFEALRPATSEAALTQLQMRVRYAQIFSSLNRIAAAYGPIREYTAEVDAFVKTLGFPDDDQRSEVRRRLENGFAVEAYTPKSFVAGTPSEGHIDTQIRAQGREPTTVTRTQCYAQLALGRAAIEARSADIYTQAIHDLTAAQKELWPQLPITRDDADADSPPRPFAGSLPVVRDEDLARLLATSESILLLPNGGASDVITSAEPNPIPAGGDLVRTLEDEVFERSQRSSAEKVERSGPPARCGAEDDEEVMANSSSDETAAQVRSIGAISTLKELCEAAIARRQVKDPKRQRQFHSTAKLLQIVAGTDQCSKITESIIEDFRDLLDLLPPNFGKSPADMRKTVKQLAEEGKALPPNMRGLKPGTINRKMGEVRAMIKTARQKGYRWVSADFEIDHVRDPEAARDKRNRFEDDQLAQLFSHEVWADPTKSVWPSVYFVPILSLYGLARREEIVGLQYRDIYISSREIHIRPNANRRLKNGESDRIVPIPEEAIRLGFLDYLATLSGDPFGDVFPEIKEAAPRTKMGDTFYKRWVPILHEAIPNAKEAGLVFHSFRHTGIDIFVNMPGVPEEVRRGLSGHAQRGVDVTVYLKKISSQSMRRIMKKFPIFTSHVEPRDWKKPRERA